MKKICKILLFLAVFLIYPVEAKEINHFTSKVDNDIVAEDTYNASVAVAGETIDLSGVVKGIMFGAGNKVTYEGNSDYLVLAGNSINIKGIINNDAFLAGNLITSEDSAIFKRDAIIAGADIELNGNFVRNISIYGSQVTFKNATISGNVKIYGSSLTIQKGTTIKGTLSYPEDSQIKISKEATIGKIVKTEAIKTTDEENYFATVQAKIWSFLCLTLIFAVVSLLFPKIFRKIDEKYEKLEFGEIIEVFTKGLVIIIVTPIIAIILFLTMIGIPLGIILFLLFAISLYLTTIFTSYLLGYKIWQKVFEKEGHILLIGIVGLFIIFLLNLIPGVRFLVAILTVLIGLGLIFNIIKSK